MSRPRFLADNDLNDAIAVGVLRREPAAEFARLRDLDLATRSDPEVLDFAARENWIVVSHDVNTMREAGSTRLAVGLPMNGLLLAHQRTPVSAIIESLLPSGPRAKRRNGPARSSFCRFDARGHERPDRQGRKACRGHTHRLRPRGRRHAARSLPRVHPGIRGLLGLESTSIAADSQSAGTPEAGGVEPPAASEWSTVDRRRAGRKTLNCPKRPPGSVTY